MRRLLISALIVSVLSVAGASAAPAATCGDKLLEAGETCAQCPADCTAQPCAAGKSRAKFAVEFTPPPAPDVTTVLLRIGYRTDRMGLPGSGTDQAVRARVKPMAHTPMLVPNNAQYALRVVVGGPPAVQSGQLVTVEFDRCQGAPPPTVADLSCQVEACANSAGPVDGCQCKITAAAH